MSYDEYGPSNPTKRTVTERVAGSTTLMAYARVAMVIIGFMAPPMLGLAAWVANRLVTTMDKVIDKQEQEGREYSELKTQVLNIVSSQVQNSRNIAERIEQGERVLNDRINAQGNWLTQMSAKFEDLSKFVYQNLRAR